MRSERADATVGVSCGHRVPRVPVLSEPNARGQRRKLYWCETCGVHRMSGGSSSGVAAFDFLLGLRDDIAASEVPIAVDDPGTEHGRAVVRALGATIR